MNYKIREKLTKKVSDTQGCSIKANFSSKNNNYKWLNINPNTEKYRAITHAIRAPLRRNQYDAFDGDNVYHNNLTRVASKMNPKFI